MEERAPLLRVHGVTIRPDPLPNSPWIPVTHEEEKVLAGIDAGTDISMLQAALLRKAMMYYSILRRNSVDSNEKLRLDPRKIGSFIQISGNNAKKLENFSFRSLHIPGKRRMIKRAG